MVSRKCSLRLATLDRCGPALLGPREVDGCGSEVATPTVLHLAQRNGSRVSGWQTSPARGDTSPPTAGCRPPVRRGDGQRVNDTPRAAPAVTTSRSGASLRGRSGSPTSGLRRPVDPESSSPSGTSSDPGGACAVQSQVPHAQLWAVHGDSERVGKCVWPRRGGRHRVV
jgi:hypothetical protein